MVTIHQFFVEDSCIDTQEFLTYTSHQAYLGVDALGLVRKGREVSQIQERNVKQKS